MGVVGLDAAVDLDLDREKGVIRDAKHPFSKDGGLAVLKGNLAIDGCIVKTAGVDESILKFEGPAIVFESQDAAVLGILNGQVKAEGIDLVPSPVRAPELFWRQLSFADFDVSEMSMSSLMMALAVTAICLLGAPEGVAAIEKQVDGRDVTLVLGAVDERLNERGYIVPGLGDAGDRQFGTTYDPGAH